MVVTCHRMQCGRQTGGHRVVVPGGLHRGPISGPTSLRSCATPGGAVDGDAARVAGREQLRPPGPRVGVPGGHGRGHRCSAHRPGAAGRSRTWPASGSWCWSRSPVPR